MVKQLCSICNNFILICLQKKYIYNILKNEFRKDTQNTARHSSVAKVSQDYCETMRPRLVSRDCNTNANLSKI